MLEPSPINWPVIIVVMTQSWFLADGGPSDVLLS